jgi:hypothetical protein
MMENTLNRFLDKYFEGIEMDFKMYRAYDKWKLKNPDEVGIKSWFAFRAGWLAHMLVNKKSLDDYIEANSLSDSQIELLQDFIICSI